MTRTSLVFFELELMMTSDLSLEGVTSRKKAGSSSS